MIVRVERKSLFQTGVEPKALPKMFKHVEDFTGPQ